MSVGRSVGLSVFGVTHSFDDPHVAPYWPTWPCYLNLCHFQTKKDENTRLAPNESIFQELFKNIEFYYVFMSFNCLISLSKVCLFSRVHATLQPALSVGQLVGWLVTLYFFL